MRTAERRLLRAPEMQDVDRLTQEQFKIPGPILMENAGQKAWAFLREEIERSVAAGRIVFVAGNGNNGGDALVMARQCAVEGAHLPSVVTVRAQLRDAAAEQWAALQAIGVERVNWEEQTDLAERLIAGADCIVDGISGTGLKGPLRDLEARLVAAINAAPGRRAAIDLPSGMRDAGGTDEPRVRADLTISTGYRKRLLYAPSRRPDAGTITWVDPGFPPRVLEEIVAPKGPGTWIVNDAPSSAPPALLRPDAHKGERGRVTVIAGGAGTEGAAILAAVAAGTAGAGMVRAWGTPETATAGLQREPGVMWRAGLPGPEEYAWTDAVVCGPGWTGATPAHLAAVITETGSAGVPLLLDAAALRLLPQIDISHENQPPGRRGRPLVLTPHPGELAHLAGTDVSAATARPYELLDEVARRYAVLGPVLILLKSSASILRGPEGDFFVTDGRCSALGVAGSGDVLSGIIGARLAAAAARDGGTSETVLEGVGEHLLRGRLLARSQRFFTAGTLASFSPPAVEDSATRHDAG